MPMSTPPGLSVLSRACEGCILLASCKASPSFFRNAWQTPKTDSKTQSRTKPKSPKEKNTGKNNMCRRTMYIQFSSWSVPLLLPVPLVITCEVFNGSICPWVRSHLPLCCHLLRWWWARRWCRCIFFLCRAPGRKNKPCESESWTGFKLRPSWIMNQYAYTILLDRDFWFECDSSPFHGKSLVI